MPAEDRHRRSSRTGAATPALLKGLIFGPDDEGMHRATPGGVGGCTGLTGPRLRSSTGMTLTLPSVSAGEVEGALVGRPAPLRAPGGRSAGPARGQADGDELDRREVAEAVQRARPL